MPAERVAAAQEGARGWVRQAAELSARGVAWTTPRALLATLCASALVPMALAEPGPAALAAGLNVVGSVGANLLSDLIGAALAAATARERDGRTAARPSGAPAGSGHDDEALTRRAVRELADRLEEVLEAGDARAEALAGALGTVLAEVEATRVVVAEALARGDARLLEELGKGFAELGRQMEVLAPLLGRLTGAVDQIQRILLRQDAERRFDRAQIQREVALLLVMREQLGELAGRLPVVATTPGTRPGAGGGSWADRCPYQGLAPFGPAQAGVFYGRGQATAELTAMITAHRGSGLILVTGASGAGKSSLVHAGLLPALATPSVSGAGGGATETWSPVTLTPGAGPLRELAVHLAVRCGADPASVWRELRADPAQAGEWARQVLTAERARHRREGGAGEDPTRLLVVVDQFEELFTLAPENEAEAFVTALEAITMVAGPGGPFRGDRAAGVVVVTVRGDFADRCAVHPVLRRALQERVFVLGPMSEQELQRAITGPAAAAGLMVEADLAEQVVRELLTHVRAPSDGSPAGTGRPGWYGAGALPLLSVAMVRTWENRKGGSLTLTGYDRSGGVASAVQDAAEDVYASLDPGRRETAKRLILALIVTGADGQATRRRVALRDVAGLCAPARPGLAREVVEVFTVARLMITAGAEAGGEAGTVELAHDVLLVAWPRLREWLAEEQADRILHGQILHAAGEWEAHGRDQSFLYRGVRLEDARGAVTRWRADPERYAGLALPEHGDTFLRAGVRAATRTRRRWGAVTVALAGLLVIAVVTALIALRVNREVEQRSAEALSRSVSASSRSWPDDPMTSARLAVAAFAIAPTAEARASMVALLGTPARAVLNGHTSSVTSLAYSPDGTRLASAGLDFTVRIWDLTSGRQAGPALKGHGDAVYAVAFSPDGTRLASGGADRMVRIWDAATGRQVGAPLSGHTGTVASVAFSPDGTRLASAGNDHTVRIWDVASGRQVGAPLLGHTREVTEVAFSPDGTRLATSGADATVRIWDAATGRQAGAPLLGHAGEVYAVAFSPDGTRLASGGDDHAVRIWDVASGRRVGSPLTGFADPVIRLAFSPDGSRLVTAGDGTAVRIWDVATGRRIGTPLTGHTGEVYAVAFSPDGSRLASGGAEGTVRIWDAAAAGRDRFPLIGPTEAVTQVAFGPGGTRLAVAGLSAVRIWDVAAGRQVGAPLQVLANSVAFSPDGRRMVVSASDGTVRIFDMRTRAQVRALPAGDAGRVTSVTFSPDGRRLASSGADGTVRVWQVASGRQVGAPLTGHKDRVTSVTFSPDGSRLASGGKDPRVWLWDVGLPRDLLQAACRVAGRGFTRQEWQQYVSTAPYQPTCPAPQVLRSGAHSSASG